MARFVLAKAGHEPLRERPIRIDLLAARTAHLEMIGRRRVVFHAKSLEEHPLACQAIHYFHFQISIPSCIDLATFRHARLRRA